MWPLTAVAALLLGLVVGFLLWGGSEGQPAVVTRNGVELTQRQVEMVDVAEQYVAAWQANDGDALTSFMTPDATFSHADLNDEYTVADGSLQTLVSRTAVYSTMQLDEPMLVDGDHLVLVGRIDSMNLEFLSVIDFTSDDPPLIESEVVYFVS
jgi:hypothetical protein